MMMYSASLISLSPRAIALGAMASVPAPVDGADHTLEDGESVTLTYSRCDMEGDPEFMVNHDLSRRITYSQLSGTFIREDARSVYSGTLTVSGRHHAMAATSAGLFRELTEGRTFTVRRDDSMYLINRWHPKVRSLGGVNDVAAYICESLDLGHAEDVDGMTVKAPCYSLEEERLS